MMSVRIRIDSYARVLSATLSLGLRVAAVAMALVTLPGMAKSLLTGNVHTASGSIEGVLIKATDANGVGFSIFSRADGSYSFPDRTLRPAIYNIDIRAAGYELVSPVTVNLTAGHLQKLALELVQAPDPSQQWNNAEWLGAAPPSKGSVDQRFVLNMCTHCHSVERIFRSTMDQSQLEATIQRMGLYAAPATPEHLVLRPGATLANNEAMDELALMTQVGPGVRDLAQYIAGTNLSAGRTELPFKPQALPRPKGEATKAIIRSWRLPRHNAMPHDVVVDSKGIVWYTDFGAQIIGRLDPATGAIREYDVPTLKPDAPKGSLEIRFGFDGAIWLGMAYQGGVTRFDPKTEKFQTWSVPDDQTSFAVQTGMVVPDHADVDGKVWIVDASIAGIHRLDLHSGKFETFRPFATARPTKGTGFKHMTYGLATDKENNAYFSDWGDSQLGRIDARTGKITFYQTQIVPSRPRRVDMDDNERFWYAAWQGNAVGYLDTKTGESHEWQLPIPNSAPYDVAVDSRGDAWAVGMASDRVQRVNTRTGRITEYLLPNRNFNARRAFIQNTKMGPVFWVGDNLGAEIFALQSEP